MEGKEASQSHHSEESSMLDLPSACDLAENFLPPHSAENSEEPCFSVDTLPSPSTVPGGCSARGAEKANLKAGLCEPAEPSNAALSWMYEHDSAEDSSVGKSLDSFYETYCETQLGRRDPTCEAGSRCLSQKISELANREGTKYALRCLQMAQVVLNRDGCKIFPNHPTTACFSKPTEGEVMEEQMRTPGLSDDVLQLLLKQTR
ncbi:Uncharacterized protein C20orf196, partial [Struthio camelus australis]